MPDRYMKFRCEHCGQAVLILDHTQSVNCGTCGAELVVHRNHGTITVKIRKAEQESNKAARFAPELIDELTAELAQLDTELARIRRPKIVVAVVGGCCALIFGAFAISALLSTDTNIGLTMLLCAGGSSWFVLFVQRDGAAVANKTALRVAKVKDRIGENARVCFAAKKGIHIVAIDLFLHEIKYYPAWIHHSHSYVPARITDAVKVGTDSVRLTIDGSEYLLTLMYEHRNSECAQVVLSLFVDDSLVLSTGAELRESSLMVHTSAHYVNTIVDGAWIEVLFGLWAEGRAEAEFSHDDMQTTPIQFARRL
jgi:ribosomal protein S27E